MSATMTVTLAYTITGLQALEFHFKGLTFASRHYCLLSATLNSELYIIMPCSLCLSKTV